MYLEPAIWGPPVWFVLLTFALAYPLKPNAVTKRKYYDFVQNLPLFLPEGTNFAEVLDRYPVTPYLEGRESFTRWVIFVHNRINESLGKPAITIEDALAQYHEHYKPKPEVSAADRRRREKLVYLGAIAALLALALVVYFKGIY